MMNLSFTPTESPPVRVNAGTFDWSQLQLSDLAPDDQSRLQAFVDYLLRKGEERRKESAQEGLA